MKLFRGTAAKVIAPLVIVLGVTATSLAGGASIGTPSRLAATGAHSAVATQPSTTKPVYVTYTINASYSGTISIQWNASGPSKASITGKGKGTEFGLVNVSGSGTSVAAAQVDPINGTGILSGYKESLYLKFATHSTATATGGSAPTMVIISGTATITKGTGRFLNAIGSLKVSGEFNIKSTTGSEKDPFNATLKGAFKVKK